MRLVEHLIAFHNMFNKCNNTGARRLKEYCVKGHTSDQLHIKTQKMCKNVQIIAGYHENLHTITHNSNGMDMKQME